MHLVWEDIENDLNRIMDSFQISFLNFINVLAMVFQWRQLIQLMKQRVKSLILRWAIYHKCIIMILNWN